MSESSVNRTLLERVMAQVSQFADDEADEDLTVQQVKQVNVRSVDDPRASLRFGVRISVWTVVVVLATAESAAAAESAAVASK